MPPSYAGNRRRSRIGRDSGRPRPSISPVESPAIPPRVPCPPNATKGSVENYLIYKLIFGSMTLFAPRRPISRARQAPMPGAGAHMPRLIAAWFRVRTEATWTLRIAVCAPSLRFADDQFAEAGVVRSGPKAHRTSFASAKRRELGCRIACHPQPGAPANRKQEAVPSLRQSQARRWGRGRHAFPRFTGLRRRAGNRGSTSLPSGQADEGRRLHRQ